MDKAAPPLVSPSSLVKTTPSKSTFSLKALAVFTASWPVIESTTNKVSVGLIISFKSAISFIITSSTANLPAVSIITKLKPLSLANLTPALAIFKGFFSSLSENTSTPIPSPTICN